jgi:EAL domain-containing protein (putative c-di-GMP-specific phosphodiesterase class I)
VQLNLFPSTLLATPVETLLEYFGDLWRDRSLYLEISDRWILGDPAQLRGSLEFLAAAGVGIALDHVGFGRSSLEALLLLGPQVIKTDARLVRGIGGDPARRRSLRRLLAIADSVGSELIALGVESADDLEALRDMGVRFAQGDGLGRPAPLPSRGTA